MKVLQLGAGAITIVLFALAGCGPSMTSLNHLAGAGEVDRNAPVLAHVQIEIAAPPPRVWALLIDAPAWPRWDPDITKVSVTQPLSMGTRFTWGEGGNRVSSEVQLFEPERRLIWTGTAFTAKAIHKWELSPEPGGHTLVTIDESMDGPLMSKLYSSQKLAEAANEWLTYLKKSAERP
jgi:uncharacterized protein YndB with AHSA1/START domain